MLPWTGIGQPREVAKRPPVPAPQPVTAVVERSNSLQLPKKTDKASAIPSIASGGEPYLQTSTTSDALAPAPARLR